MHSSERHHPAATAGVEAEHLLFLWRNDEIILIGEREKQRWVLARGWFTGDRLEHIRRWSFSEAKPFSGQVRRLVMEAIGDFAEARDEGQRAMTWANSRT